MGMHAVFDEIATEREKREQALLNAPHLIEEGRRQMSYLREDLEHSFETIEELKRDLASASSWRSKVVDYFVGGVVGTLVGAILGRLF